jgi:hypothetical protein
MPTFLTIGYGDSRDSEATDAAQRIKAHAHDEWLATHGAASGLRGCRPRSGTRSAQGSSRRGAHTCTPTFPWRASPSECRRYALRRGARCRGSLAASQLVRAGPGDAGLRESRELYALPATGCCLASLSLTPGRAPPDRLFPGTRARHLPIPRRTVADPHPASQALEVMAAPDGLPGSRRSVAHECWRVGGSEEWD